MNWFSRLPAHSRGVIYLLISVTAFAVMDMTAKLLGERVSLSQVLWARYAGQLLVLVLIFAPRLSRALRTDHPWLQMLRAIMLLGATAFFFGALQHLGLAEVIAIAELQPMLITLGAALFLKEKVGPRRGLGVAFGLLGALIIIRPGSDVFTPASLMPLAAAACVATYALATRHIGLKESPITGLLYSALFCTALMSIIVPFTWVRPDAISVGLMLAIGCLGTLAQLTLIRAYSVTEASAIAPVSHLGLLVAVALGYVVFDSLPDLWTVLGGLVIVAAALYVWHRERKTGTAVTVPEEMGQP
ncbi:DMT family transporter [Celeribacter sp. PS-C1]|uniref:DMT family transporter n=1 Tax=Celeribacter sp. PS-C1 TaxID=2820813 RepID=UPI001C66FF8D|nr:DMT family transporter [Celeribacter sp. PS-C1]MBW6417747.1 DMT family transporter [Celeribacter sp. PS-C1]